MKIAILDKVNSAVFDKTECDESMLDAFPNRYIEVKISEKILNDYRMQDRFQAPPVSAREDGLTVEKIEYILKDNITVYTDNWGHYGGINEKSIKEAAVEILAAFWQPQPPPIK